jgi:alanine racemase
MIVNTESLRCFAEIDLDAVHGNFDAIRSYVPADKKIMAIIKANGYGHGAVKLAKELTGKADYFGVAMADEAFELRHNGIDTPILILGYCQPSLFPILVRNDVRPSIFRYDDAHALNECAAAAGKIASFHIALDTGMSRIGYAVCDDSVDEIVRISKLPNVKIEGIFSHFANADCADKEYTVFQLENYRGFVKKLAERGVDIPLRHVFNSAATLELDSEFEMMREGIILYGLEPSDEVDMGKISSLRPAMSLLARIGHVKTLDEGVSVSYGCTYVTDRPTRVATVCAGYADGVPRVISNKASVLIKGRRAPIIGRICMDQFMIDVTDIPQVRVNDLATIFGRDGEESITADEVAKEAGTIGYELVCGINPRVPRVYLKNGKIESIHFVLDHEEV